jgi:hypothetical protein
MDRVFSSCNRLHDILESQGRLEEVREQNPEPLQELNLNVSTEEFLSAEKAFTFADLYATLESGDTLAWLTPHAAVALDGGLAERWLGISWIMRIAASISMPTVNRLLPWFSLPRAFIGDLRYYCSIVGS